MSIDISWYIPLLPIWPWIRSRSISSPWRSSFQSGENWRKWAARSILPNLAVRWHLLHTSNIMHVSLRRKLWHVNWLLLPVISRARLSTRRWMWTIWCRRPKENCSRFPSRTWRRIIRKSTLSSRKRMIWFRKLPPVPMVWVAWKVGIPSWTRWLPDGRSPTSSLLQPVLPWVKRRSYFPWQKTLPWISVIP